MYTILPRSNGPVLGVEITGKIGIEQEKKLIAAAEDLIEKHDKISVLIVLGDHAFMSIEAATADVKWALTHMAHLHKVAIVADSKLIAALVAIDATFAKLAGIHEMHFATDEIETAWHWIES
ncbi:STAS/SEC14 domain-containing protein [uncultured Roseibium sp.]|uniref:STAS/SEC14 domain-containing protein n=1 Tax=uncultured Roseibium sp. TaxID=1936171 RepID=UPI002616C59B|nr:STAS/SEC14 domain-containing protein [uncultured Roseibium sp.]